MRCGAYVQKIKEGVGNAKGAVVKGAKTAAAKTRDGLSKTGEVMTEITTRVHSRFVARTCCRIATSAWIPTTTS